MTRRRRLAALAIAAAIACGGKSDAPIARLLEGQGAVTREHTGKDAAAPIGQPFVLGDAARTGEASWARLELRGGAILRMGADSLVRFVPSGTRLERGEAGAEATAITVLTEAGPAIIEAGGRVRAAATADGQRVEVTVGRAIITRPDGEVALEPGGHLTVAIGGALIERVDRPAPTPPEPTPPPVAPVPPVPDVAAITATVRGRGVTARTAGGPARALPAGAAELAPGDVVKLPRGASLEVTRGDGRATATGPAELTIGAADQPLLSTGAGSAAITAGATPVAIAVPGGAITVGAGGIASVTIGRAEATARVERGEVGLDGTVSDATATAGETGVLSKDGAAAIRDRVPTTVDLELAPGAGAVVHDPGKRVAVQVDFADACGGGGTLELADRGGSFTRARRIAGDRHARFYASAGTNRYRVRCDGGATKAGSVRVVGDSGAAPVVRTPPTNLFEADGRKYGVTYQNRIPQVTLMWSEAKGASVLKLTPAGGATRTIGSSTGTHVLSPADLDEGSYSFTIVSGNRTSPPTTLRIAFDNAAPTAQITTPPARAEWTDPLTIAGVTAEGWSVAIDGQRIDRDASGRFRAQVATAGKDVVAIRLAHPEHGVHYYLRRRK